MKPTPIGCIIGIAAACSAYKTDPPSAKGSIGSEVFAAARPESSATASELALPPLDGFPWILPLSDATASIGVLTLPLGATERRPIVVAVHGAGDRPDWACGGWRIGFDAYPFVVCPKGSPMGKDRYGWASGREIATAVDRAVTEARRLFPQYVNTGPMIYAGFSQGATLAGNYLIEHAREFPVVALAEGGYGFLTDSTFARKFRAAGGRRVLVLCGSPHCMTTAKRAEDPLTRGGLDVIVVGDVFAGHNLNTAMQNVLRREWHRLVDGVAGWEAFSAHRWVP